MDENTYGSTGAPYPPGNAPDPHSSKLYLAGGEPVTPDMHEGDTVAFDAYRAPSPTSSAFAPTTLRPGSPPPTQPVSTRMDRTAPFSGPGSYGPGGYNTGGYAPQYPARSNRVFKPLWWLIAIVGMAVIAVVLAMALPSLPFFAAAGGANNAQSTQTAAKSTTTAATTTAPTPTPTPLPTPTPTPQGKIAGTGISVTPTSFNVLNDCQLNDNGRYSCTINLNDSSNSQDSIDWQANSHLIKVNFDQSNGTLNPGDQQQITATIRNHCPFTGSIKLAFNDANSDVLTIPVSCQQTNNNGNNGNNNNGNNNNGNNNNNFNNGNGDNGNNNNGNGNNGN